LNAGTTALVLFVILLLSRQIVGRREEDRLPAG
jgi:hypothetical protein